MGGLCWSASDNVLDSSPKDNKKADSSPGKSRVLDKDKAMLDLKRRRRDCDEYIKKMDLKILEAKNAAKAAAKAKDKPKAIFAMKLKKMHESTKNKAIGMLQTLETTVMNLEQASMDADVFQALKKGDEVIKELRSQASLEGFQEIYENLQEHNEVAEFMEKEVINDQDYTEELEKLEEQLEGVEENGAAEAIEKLKSADLQAPSEKLEVKKKVEVQEEKKELVLA